MMEVCRKKLAKIAGMSGLLVMWLGLITSVVNASPPNQTVPTMPPPSSSPTVTATVIIQPTSTHLPPTATAPRSTSLPPTQTAQAAATDTAVAVTHLPSSTSLAKTLTPLPTQPQAQETLPQPEGATNGSPTSQFTPVENQSNTTQGGANTGLIGLLGGGIVLIVVLLVVFSASRRRKNSQENDHKAN